MKQVFMCFVQIFEVLVWTCGVEEQEQCMGGKMKKVFMCFVQILEVLVWTCGVEEQGALWRQCMGGR